MKKMVLVESVSEPPATAKPCPSSGVNPNKRGSMENTYTKVADLGGRAKHSQLGEVNLLSKWTNSEGHFLHLSEGPHRTTRSGIPTSRKGVSDGKDLCDAGSWYQPTKTKPPQRLVRLRTLDSQKRTNNKLITSHQSYSTIPAL